MANPKLDRLTGQLYYLPAIIERLGLGVAEAQKALNEDYLTNVGRLMEMIKAFKGDATGEKAAALEALLKALAPSRYQFTETTLDFSADLSETLSAAGELGVGAGLGGVVINASVALGYGYDYRAAARVTAKLHAIAGNDMTMINAFLARAKEIDAEKLKALPDKAEVDSQLFERMKLLSEAIAKLQAPAAAGGQP